MEERKNVFIDEAYSPEEVRRAVEAKSSEMTIAKQGLSDAKKRLLRYLFRKLTKENLTDGFGFLITGSTRRPKEFNIMRYYRANVESKMNTEAVRLTIRNCVDTYVNFSGNYFTQYAVHEMTIGNTSQIMSTDIIKPITCEEYQSILSKLNAEDMSALYERVMEVMKSVNGTWDETDEYKSLKEVLVKNENEKKRLQGEYEALQSDKMRYYNTLSFNGIKDVKGDGSNFMSLWNPDIIVLGMVDRVIFPSSPYEVSIPRIALRTPIVFMRERGGLKLVRAILSNKNTIEVFNLPEFYSSVGKEEYGMKVIGETEFKELRQKCMDEVGVKI